MEKGEVRFTGPTAELLERPDILRSVFIAGASAGAPAEPDPSANGAGKRSTTVEAPAARAPIPEDAPVVLACDGVVKRFGGLTAVNDVSFELRQGQVRGLTGDRTRVVSGKRVSVRVGLGGSRIIKN